MTALDERLRDLAEAAPTDLPDADLWTQGRRLLRRRRAVTGLVTLLLVLCVGSLGGLVVDQVRQPVPASSAPAGGLGLPDRIYRPSPWLPGTDDEGPIGPLVAVLGATRSSFWGSSDGLVGISADGTYRFLDLPGRARAAYGAATLSALSADGRYVAYLVTGTTSAEPFDGDGDVVAGIAVYDTVDGTVRRDEVVASKHGLVVSDLAWAGDTLLADVATITSFAHGDYDATGVGVLSWDVTGQDMLLLSPGSLPIGQATPVADRLAVLDDRTVTLVDGKRREVGPEVDFEVAAGRVAVSPDGRRFAALEDLAGAPLRVQDMTDGATSTVVPGITADSVVGWRDDDHVLVFVQADRAYLSVDIESGASEPVVAVAEGAPGPTFAADALTGASYDAAEPDSPPSPRLLVASGVALVVLLGMSLLVLRRRRVRG